MILPTKLEITNYCQIPHLVLDLTAQGTYAITAPNATGKSNVLNALRFAFSGSGKEEKAPLEEDIRDFQSSAIVTMWFDYDGNGSGRVKRTISHSGTKVELELKCGAERELIVKSRAAEARFNELLGAPPKALCDVIIASQMEIEALLFWPAKQRASKFQRFLNGPLFSQIEKVISDEKARVILDELATERLSVLQEELSKEVKNQAQTKKNLEAAEKILQSKQCAEAIAINEKLELHAALRIQMVELVSSLEAKKAEFQQLEAELLGKKEITEFSKTVELCNQTKELWAAWDAYSSWIALKEKLEKDNREYQEDIKKSVLAVGELPNLEAEVTKIEMDLANAAIFAQQQLEAKELIICETEEANKTRAFELACQEESEAQEKFKLFYDSVAVLREALKALNSKEHTHDGCCPVCQSTISKEKAKEINTRASICEAQLLPLSQTMQEKQAARREAERDLNLVRGALSKIRDKVSQHKPIQPPTESSEILEALLAKTKDKLGQTRILASTLPQLKAKLEACTKELDQISAHPQPEATKPKLDRHELGLLQEKAREARAAINKNNELLAKKASILAVVESLEGQIEVLEKQAKDQKLPTLHTQWNASEKELSLLQYLKDATATLDRTRIENSAVSARVVVLQNQVKQVSAQIAGYEDSKKYLETLKQLASEFSPTGLPQRILHFQLHHLCNQMDSIITKFQLRNPFKICVDANLDLFMVYPTGIKRRISKASGAEKIILGLAFRLAAHRFFSPEAPFIAIDEPTNHLDETNIVVLQDLFRFLRENIGEFGLKKIIFCTHSRALAAEAATHIDLASLHQ